MGECQAFGPSESGVVKFFNKNRGYGFITPDDGEADIFFSYTVLFKANTVDIGSGTRVRFTCELMKDGKSKVGRFLEIEGVRAEHGMYSRAIDGGFRFYPDGPRDHPGPQEATANQDEASALIEKGAIASFKKDRGFGFIALDNGGVNLFFFIVELMRANRDDIEPGTRVTFIRGIAKDGRPKVARFLEIDGVSVTAGDYSLVNGQFVLHPDGKPPVAEPQEVAPLPKVETPEPVVEPQPMPAQQRAPETKFIPVTVDEWVTVKLRKLKKGQMSYADSELLGQILVPWRVLERAKIASAQNHDKFEVRCEMGGATPEAVAIRRY